MFIIFNFELFKSVSDAKVGKNPIHPNFFASKNQRAKFHANQGLVLMIAFALFSFLKLGLRAMLMIILPDALAKIIMAVIGIFSLVFPILKIVGIVNAASGKAKELPLIGSIRILK